jgi:hypothetical protein
MRIVARLDYLNSAFHGQYLISLISVRNKNGLLDLGPPITCTAFPSHQCCATGSEPTRIIQIKLQVQTAKPYDLSDQ